MSRTFKNMLASRAAAIALALLFAGVTAPFLILQSTHAFADPAPLPCTEGNHNGCTELSATPPEDMQAVPPNLILMLDDSGSMDWDFMPDWTDLNHGPYNSGTSEDDAVNDSANNLIWYNPQTTYTLPPKADGTSYPAPTKMSASWNNGFAGGATTDPAWYTHSKGGSYPGQIHYNRNLNGNTTSSTYQANYQCPNGSWKEDPSNPNQCISTLTPSSPSSYPATQVYKCTSGGTGPAAGDQGAYTCTVTTQNGETTTVTTYKATQQWTCPSGGSLNSTTLMCTIAGVTPPGPTPKIWYCNSGGSGPTGADHTCTISSTPTIGAFIYIDPSDHQPHFVTSEGGHGTCSDIRPNGTPGYLNAQANCVTYDDTSGKAAPAGIPAGQNIAIWFSYYRTRLLMAKSSLMTSFSGVDPKYRFGFGSINGNGIANIPGSPTAYSFDDSTTDGQGGNSGNKLAVVQPFGDGSAGTQKAKFWNWLSKITAAKTTPLRKALNAVGQYYSTADPWAAMVNDPGWTTGSTTKFTCRAAYTILTTDGFWNGDKPTDPSDLGGAANTAGPVQVVPTGAVTQYNPTAPSPYLGGGIDGDVTLTDVATYYWERDLNSDLDNEVAAGKADPASWQHMTTYTIGLGYDPTSTLTPAHTTVPQIFGWANGGAQIDGFSWPTPASNSLNNIADLAHAALNGHGDFFNANNATDLSNAFSKALSDINGRNTSLQPAGVNASVLSLGAAAFRSNYETSGWTSQFQAVSLKADGTVGQILWQADALLDATYHSSTEAAYSGRKVYTGAYTVASGVGTFSAFQFNAANSASLDATESAGLLTPALTGDNDSLDNRISYLLGANTYEGSPYRTRTSILGAIIHSEPAYVAGAAGNYRSNWPTFGTFTPPEADATTENTYDAFVNNMSTREPMVYIGANDGMLHAFYAPVPSCTGTVDTSGNCSAYTYPDTTNQGQEAWAFVPRAVYANLGNLTNNDNFQYRPTVDSTPVTRDVFFSEGGSGVKDTWHTILTGGVGLGGRGVYALDITDPTTFSATNVLWEFDADMQVPSTCVSNSGACQATDLGFTVSQPNVGRLSNGKWVVLVPNGYFPDCSTPGAPTKDIATCNAIAAQVPKDASGNPYSALFVLDAQTGELIAELKTPTISGVTSFGLAKAVLGDYTSDQVDDVAFAGDVQGNLWRFDLSDTDPSNWTVSLVYKGLTDSSGNQGVQPITTMPRLFPDPGTNRFLVLFGTGKYLGVGDNTNTTQQAVYAVRDTLGTTWTQGDLTQQYLHESVVPDGEPNAGSILRCVTGSATDTCSSSSTAINALPGSGGGWYINLYTTDSAGTHNDDGERIVVNPGAIFASNTVVFESMITGSPGSNACNPSLQGAILALDATTGGSAGMSSLGSWPTAGARINNGRSSGSLPVVSALGGGQAYLPGATLAPSSSSPISLDAPIWRRRSWRVLLHDQ